MANGRKPKRANTIGLRPEQWPWFWIMAGFVVLVFLTGGSSRASVMSLPILRPVAAMLLALALLAIRRRELVAHRVLVGFFIVIVGAVLVQLIPLPPSVWMQLPHRSLAVLAAQSAGQAGEWRPLTLDLTATRNAAYSLLVPGAALAGALCLNVWDRLRLMAIMLGLGGLAIVLGVLQVSTSPADTFYFYRLSTKFVPTGFFANPNHNAVFLATLLPMAALWASRLHGHIGPISKELIVKIIVVLLAVLTILLAGSRAGIFLLLIGLAAMPWARWSRGIDAPRTSGKSYGTAKIALIAVGIGVVGVALAMGRAGALDRLLANTASGDLRLRVWPIITNETLAYFPAGAGWGSFVQTFQIAEPYSLLKPTYLNHAHNDWLEVVMNGGAVGAILLAFVLGWWIWSLSTLRTMETGNRPQAWVGLVGILLLGLSSMVDYPLRTPCLQVLFVLAWLWVEDGRYSDLSGVRRRKSIADPGSTDGM